MSPSDAIIGPLQSKWKRIFQMFQGRRWSIPGVWWSIGIRAGQERIRREDTAGEDGYALWIRTVEAPALQKVLAEARKTRAPETPQVSFLISEEGISQSSVEQTLTSLDELPERSWRLVFLLEEDSPVRNTPWFQDLCRARSEVLAISAFAGSSGWLADAARLPGDWLVPVRAGDRLASAWMDIFGLYLQRRPDAGVFYWDEDLQDGQGGRVRPFFKPDWSPDLLVSADILESAAVRKSVLSNLSHHADESIWIWVAAQTEAVHIPYVLQNRFPLAGEDGFRTTQHLKKAAAWLHMLGAVEPVVSMESGQVRAAWKANWPMVSVIIPTRNNLHFLRRCLTTLYEKTDYPSFEVVLMDDHSEDADVLDYYEKLRSDHANLRIIANEGPFNYSRVNNQGARQAKGGLLLFLNNDVEIIEAGWLKEMARWACLPGAGVVGVQLMYPGNTIQHAGIVLGMTGNAGHVFAGDIPALGAVQYSPDWYRDVSAVTGACMLFRREVFEKIGGFEEQFLLVFNDVEICMRAWASGYRVIYTPAARLIHYEGRSRARFIPHVDIRLGTALLHSAVERGDPYYNPNLSLAVNWPTFRRADEPNPVQRLDAITRFKS